MLAFFQVFLGVYLSIEQSDREAPGEQRRGSDQPHSASRSAVVNVSEQDYKQMEDMAYRSEHSPSNEAEDIKSQVEYGEGSKGDEEQHDSKTPPSPDGQTGLKHTQNTGWMLHALVFTLKPDCKYSSWSEDQWCQ